MQKRDSVSLGVFVGLMLPLILMAAFIVYSYNTTGLNSLISVVKHYQSYNILYKILSVSLMPGAGLFFYWSRINKLNQARGVLMMSLFYGVMVLVLYMS
ncbi:MAG: hypothetical protein AB7S69_04290 [Salinivirgaceae bacterium]|jgi:hypothetical protein